MAGKKRPYSTFETKEDFEKWYDRVEKAGYERGYEAGIVTALSYIIGPANEIFSNYKFESEDEQEDLSRFSIGRVSYGKDLISDAMNEYTRRELLLWKKREKQKTDEIKYKVEQELKKSSENPKT